MKRTITLELTVEAINLIEKAAGGISIARLLEAEINNEPQVFCEMMGYDEVE